MSVVGVRILLQVFFVLKKSANHTPAVCRYSQSVGYRQYGFVGKQLERAPEFESPLIFIFQSHDGFKKGSKGAKEGAKELE